MAGITYKCPSCGGYLNFDPDGGQWKCPFCHSTFQEDQLLTGEGERTGERPDTASEKDGAQVTYHCPSCGSQIVTDETTVATHCYYCHSPVVLQGKLTDDMRPDGVLPFAIDQQKATTSFMDWVRRKRFVPKGFFSEQQVEPQIRQQGAFKVYEAGPVTILCGDVFALTEADVASCVGLYDRAATIALPAEMRAAYAQHLNRILPRGCRGLLITLDYDQSQMNGPPFSVPDAEVQSLLAPAWTLEIIEQPDVLDQEWKFLKGGVTRLVERVYRLEKTA